MGIVDGSQVRCCLACAVKVKGLHRNAPQQLQRFTATQIAAKRFLQRSNTIFKAILLHKQAPFK